MEGGKGKRGRKRVRGIELERENGRNRKGERRQEMRGNKAEEERKRGKEKDRREEERWEVWLQGLFYGPH